MEPFFMAEGLDEPIRISITAVVSIYPRMGDQYTDGHIRTA